MFRNTALIIVCSVALLACGGQENDTKATKIAPPKVTPQETAESTVIDSSETVGETVADDNYGSTGNRDEIEVTTIAISEQEMPEAEDIEEEYSDAVAEVEAFVADVTDSSEEEIAVGIEKSVYTVQSGDVLSAIARAHNTTVDAIVMTNGLSNPNSIAVGQKLVIE